MDEPREPNRRSIRLKEYDYGQPGAYFVTSCTHRRECLCGEMFEGKMRLNKAGIVVQSIWQKLPKRYSLTSIGAYIIMSNHFHGIITIGEEAIHESPLQMPMLISRRRKMVLSKMVGI